MNGTATTSSESIFDAAFLARLEHLSLVAKRVRARGDRGGHRGPRRGASVEFADHRSYNPGDDFRRIDWNLYGRLLKLYMKLYVEEVDLTLSLVLDGSASMAFGTPPKWDSARRLAGALGFLALKGLDRVRLGVHAGAGFTAFGPARGRGRVFALFDFLSACAATGQTDLGRVLRERKPDVGGVTVIVSDFLCETSPVDAVRRLCAVGQRVVLLQVLAREELEPDMLGDLMLEDSESGATVEVTAGGAVLRAYRESLAGLRAELEGLARHGAVTHVLVPSDADVVEMLLTALPRAGVLR